MRCENDRNSAASKSAMTSSRVHPVPEHSAADAAAIALASSQPLPLKFCSLFQANLIDSSSLPGLAYQLLPADASTASRSSQAKLLGVAKRHSRYQFLMNFRLHGSRFAAALSITFHIVCIFILILELAVLHRDVTGNNSVSNGAAQFCSTQCENSGVCSSFEAPSTATSTAAVSSTNSSKTPPDSCSCLPGFYGNKCQLDLRSPSVKKTGCAGALHTTPCQCFMVTICEHRYSFSTALFKKVYEQAMIYMIFITACLCMVRRPRSPF